MKGKKLLAFIIIIFALGILAGYLISQYNLTNGNSREKGQFLVQREIPVLGIDGNGRGVVGILITELKSGNGMVLVNINDVVADYEMQLSARIAAMAAANITGADLSNLDILFNLKTNASLIAGPSAGSAMAVSTIAALTNKSISEGIFITGAVDENGALIGAGAIEEKALAAKEEGATALIIPNAVTGYEQQKTCTSYKDYTYCETKTAEVKRQLDISGLRIIQASTIQEAMEYILK